MLVHVLFCLKIRVRESVCVFTHLCHSTQVQRLQDSWSSLLTSCGLWGLNSGHPAWHQVLLCTKPSLQPTALTKPHLGLFFSVHFVFHLKISYMLFHWIFLYENNRYKRIKLTKFCSLQGKMTLSVTCVVVIQIRNVTCVLAINVERNGIPTSSFCVMSAIWHIISTA